VIPATRELVQDAMRQLGYRPNSAARALKYGNFRTIGVILFSLANVGNSKTLEGIAAEATARGYGLTLMPVAAPTEAAVIGAFGRLEELAVDAVIVIMEIHLLDAATVGLPPGAPVVVVDSNAGDRYPVVDTDQFEGARLAVEHLLGLGHKTVWHVAGPKESFASERRMEAWRDTLTAAGRDVPRLLRGDWSAESGYAAGQEILAEESVTAVFVSNDQMALGLMNALHEGGRRVPQDVSVVGFDDLPDSAAYLPPLTTIHQDFTGVGHRCVEDALDQVEHGASAPGVTLVPTRLVVRKSTAAPSAPS
jgi:DNA-binding LacI/PurR family transcriptional regulator